MKQSTFRRRIVAAILFIVVFSLCQLSVAVSEEITTEQEVKEQNSIAVLMITDDAFASVNDNCRALKSVTVENGNEANLPTVQNAVEAFARIMEAEEWTVHLQGPTSNGQAGKLRYTTGKDDSPNWVDLSVKGTDDTFSRSFGSLKISEYNHLLVIGGGLSAGTIKAIDSNARNVRYDVPTVLYQLSEWNDGSALSEKYEKMAGVELTEPKQDKQGFTYYQAVGKDDMGYSVASKVASGITPEEMLKEWLFQTVFSDAYTMADERFGIPMGLISDAVLLIRGDDLSNIALVSPNGKRYTAELVVSVDNGSLYSTETQWGSERLRVISLKNVMTQGEWKVECDGNWQGTVFYTKRDDFADKLTGAPIVSFGEVSAMGKGKQMLSVIPDGRASDCFLLYPKLKMKVTDSFGNSVINEWLSTDDNPSRVEISLQRGGTHELTIRLMNGEEEILSQTQKVQVTDEPPAFVEQNMETIWYDTLPDGIWTYDATRFFNDPDGDAFEISRTGGERAKVKVEDNKLVLTFDENAEEGSENVSLSCVSDVGNAGGTVTVVWKSLKKLMEELQFDCAIEPLTEGEALAKRTTVRLAADLVYDGEDEDVVLEQLKNCDSIVEDSDGNEVAVARFDREEKRFLSDSFEFPDIQSDYTWKLVLKSAEQSVPTWEVSDQTGKVSVKNHAPVIDEKKMDDSAFGEKHPAVISEWEFYVPGDLASDEDGDPVHYEVYADDKLIATLAETRDFEQPVHLEKYGNYTIKITALDNEDMPSVKSYEKTVNLLDLNEEVKGATAVYEVDGPADEEGCFAKRAQVTLSMKVNQKDWSDEKKAAVDEWIANGTPSLVVNGTVLSDVNVEYSPKTKKFECTFNLPETAADNQCVIRLESDEEKYPELTKDFNAQIVTTVGHSPYLVGENPLHDVSEWLVKAEEYTDLVVPNGVVADEDNDELTCNVRLVRSNGTEVFNEENVELPYTVRFPAFGTFTFTDGYRVEVNFADNDGNKVSLESNVKLINLQLIIIVAVILVILIILIIALVLYLRYRNNLPAFGATVRFVRDGKPVSRDIDLRLWEKQKHLPLAVFAGAITVCLTDEQWNELKGLELRPNKKDGYTIHRMEDKKGDPAVEQLQSGIEIEKIS